MSLCHLLLYPYFFPGIGFRDPPTSDSPIPFEVNDLPEDQLHQPRPSLPAPPSPTTSSLMDLRPNKSTDPTSFGFRKCSTLLSTGTEWHILFTISALIVLLGIKGRA